jgi:hypothetical protein
MSNDDSIREVIRHYSDVDESSWLRTKNRFLRPGLFKLKPTRKAEHEPSILGGSSHIMALARKQTQPLLRLPFPGSPTSVYAATTVGRAYVS